MRLQSYYQLTLGGFFIVLLTLIIWPVCCADEQIPVMYRWVILVGPLLFPIRGLLKGNSYTFAWSHFLALFYFILAVVTLWQGEHKIYGSLLLLGSLCWFSFALLYVRKKAKENKPSD